jgi:hypothetical protein
MRRRSHRGAAAVVVILLILLIGAAGYWFYRQRGGGGAGGSSFDMAAHLPKTAHAAFLINLQGQLDVRDLKKHWEDVAEAMPAEDKKKLEDDLRENLGMSVSEFVKMFDGRAAVAVVPKEPGQPPGWMGLVGLKDAAAFDKFAKDKSAGQQASQELVAGVQFTFTDEGAMGYDQQWIYFADSKSSAELLLAAAAGQETLASQPAFAEARTRVVGDSSASAFYWDIASTVKTLEPLKLPSTDAQTYKELACLQYAVGSVDLRSMQCNAYLKVLDDKTSLSGKLLARGSVNPESFGGLTGATDMGFALDVEWLYNTVIALMMVSPDSRETAGMASVGLVAVGNPFGAFEGEIAMTNDGMSQTSGILTKNFGRARSQGQLTACKSNLRNMATAQEMYSTDWNGHYAPSMALLTPNYLKTIPECPAAGSDTYSSTLKVTSDPDTYSLACSGNHHQQANDNLPAYNSTEGLVEGTPIPGDEAEDNFVPSSAVTATVKDLKLAHALLLKAFPDAGAEPKAGEEKVYPFPYPGSVLKITGGTPPRLVFGYGPRSEALLDTKQGTLADHRPLHDVLSWGGDGVIYADYLNFEPTVAALAKSVESDDSEEAKLARVMLDKLKRWELESASAVVARPDGLYWQARGGSAGMVAVAGIGAAVLMPNFVRARSQGQLTGCKSNLKNIGTAMEMYSTDYTGKYPDSMEKLTPNYLRALPECPAAEKVTYRAHMGPNAKGNTEKYEDYYYIECAGHNHQAVSVPADFPAYSGIQGLLEGPEQLLR